MARLPDANQAHVAGLIRQAGYPQDTPSTSVFRMLAHAPAVSAPALRLVAAILTETDLGTRMRQMLILRVAERCQARHAWIQHGAIAVAVGVGAAQLASLELGEIPDGLLSGQERLALAFVDAILDDPRVDDDTFARVREQFSPRQVVEMLLIVGYFRMMASLMTTLDVEPDPACAVDALDRASTTDGAA
jgi:alkylhydroperoxidase family enzyme